MRQVVHRIVTVVIAQATRVDAEVEQPGDLGDVTVAQGEQGVAARFSRPRARLAGPARQLRTTVKRRGTSPPSAPITSSRRASSAVSSCR